MEFPDIGVHCENPACKALDFLPVTCVRCQKTFCHDHTAPAQHACAYLNDPRYDRVVPMCPLCNAPVPVLPGEDPNARVDAHIAAGCTRPPSAASSAPALSRCGVKGCGARSVVPITCKACGNTYCIKHRLERDHACAPPPPPPTTAQRIGGMMGGGKKASSSSKNGAGSACAPSPRPGRKAKAGTSSSKDCSIM
ncbi:hypothetical protein BC828DRAFT_373024 [Blastocladiella britannica]|nr:hypothetical protein BC828DRAFT_373024 [Blastocladiella britannica]